MSSDKVLYVNPETKDVIATGNVGIGTTNPLSTLHVNGSLYCPGAVVQCQTVVYTQHTTYSLPAVLSPTEMSVLNISITPKRSSSKIVLQWMINCEAQWNTVFLVYRNSTLIGYNTSEGNVQWSSVSCIPFDNEQGTTPANVSVSWIDLPNTTSSTTYSVRVRTSESTSNSSNNTIYLNRTIYSNTYNQEAMCSTGLAWEVCV